MRLRFRHSLLFVASMPIVAAAQQAPRALPAPDKSLEEPFSRVDGLRELSTGKLIVADSRDKILHLVDFAAGSTSPIGREGSGPGEFALPFRVLLAPGDTTFIFDIGNQRYLTIGSDGKPGKDFRVEEVVPPRGDGPRNAAPQQTFRVGLNLPRASDSRGRLYWEGPPFGPPSADGGPPVSADSVPIIRHDLVTKKSDTLAYVRIPKNNAQVTGSAGRVSVQIGGANPLLPRDEWTVFPDGRVAIVRSPEYRVDWVMPNLSRVIGKPITFTAIRVGAAEKAEEEELRNWNRQNAMMMTVNSGSGGTNRNVQMGPGANAPKLEPLTDWPAVKPPFRSGAVSVWARPNGELWVRRTEAAGAKGTLYDVLNAQGVVTHQVRFPEKVVLAGFGNGTIYTTKADEDDLLYLQRHRGL
jgi:hypothetical protein